MCVVLLVFVSVLLVFASVLLVRAVGTRLCGMYVRVGVLDPIFQLFLHVHGLYSVID